jgi:hypothetical protein
MLQVDDIEADNALESACATPSPVGAEGTRLASRADTTASALAAE